MRTNKAMMAIKADAFHRGIRASIRALERETPLARGSIEVLKSLLVAAGGK